MDGIIIIDKPIGITSFDVIRKLRKILKIKKIGHTGTLDPLATGVMIICIGKATKLASDLEAMDKIYLATFELGYSTDTYDIQGQILEKSDKKIFRDDIERSISKFIGNIKQIPPMYSAIKIEGKKLYELARKGIEIERKAKDINIEYIELLKYKENNVEIRTKVSKGCYIRSLINDIGKDLQSFATMTTLRREQVGDFTLKESCTFEQIEEMVDKNDFSFIENIENHFNYDKYNLESDKEKILYLNGNTVKINKKLENKKYRIYYQDIFLGLAKVENNILLKAYKYF